MKTIAPLFIFLLTAPSVAAQTATPGPAAIEIGRVAAPITIDGNVSPDEWSGATRIDQWFEFSPGDNVEPKVRSVGYVAHDDRFFYIGMVLSDPDPASIRAPYADRDDLNNSTDFAGVILNPSNDHKTGVEMFANAHGVQADGINSDATGEDMAPDFYWDSAGRITNDGWMLEMRIPFSSLRYSAGANQTWNILLYRNYPRDRRYQFASQVIPRGSNCTVCLLRPLTGLQNLPSASHIIVAPYATARQTSVPVAGPGSRMKSGSGNFDFGADMKWTPNTDLAIDTTINPDFSQVESDVAAITSNERFAVFFPEKRPFFLEGKDLFETPIQAVYTRDINAPRWGARATGAVGTTAYTLLVADDRGGGAVIIPGPNNSSFASQDFASRNLIGRARHDIGTSFVSFLVTDREIRGGGHNRVFGPDALWRIGANDNIRAQFLLSDSATPLRPDLADEWDGRKLSSHAGQLEWSHSTQTLDWRIQLIDRGNDFRADLGFVPQVGTRESFGWAGYTWHPQGFFSRVRAAVMADYTGQRDGALVYRFVSPQIEADGRWSSSMSASHSFDKIRAGDRTIERNQWEVRLGANPTRVIQHVELEARFGSDIDFANARPGRGASIQGEAVILPTDHLELAFNNEYRYLDVLNGERLFTARVERLKATYNFTSRSFLRLVGQHVRTDRDPALYLRQTGANEGTRSLSALYAYKLNWQTVLYVGYGDLNELTSRTDYSPAVRQAFVKVSYAWQR